MKKYELTEETIEVKGRTLYRIRRLCDGLLGGYIESESNLSQEGSCFVYDQAKVSGSALVSGEAQVFGEARVSGEARVFDSAQVYGSARVYGSAVVYGEAQVSGSAVVYGEAQVSGEARVFDSARVYGSAQVYGSARVFDSAWVFGEALVYGEARVSGSAWVSDEARFDKATYAFFKYPILVGPEWICIGCESHSLEQWRANINEIGKKSYCSLEDVELTKQLLSRLYLQLGSRPPEWSAIDTSPPAAKPVQLPEDSAPTEVLGPINELPPQEEPSPLDELPPQEEPSPLDELPPQEEPSPQEETNPSAEPGSPKWPTLSERK
jgi:hypothetical protein